jgi:D-amino-acid dehydrogenase
MTASDSGPDVAIIGGGIVGTATAAFLAGAGARVRLYEATEVAAAASGRNSGVIQHPFDPVLVGLHRESLELYRARAREAAGFGLPAEPAGLLSVGFDPAAAERDAAAWQAQYPETRPQILTGSALHQLEPALAPDVVACRLEIGYPVAPASATRAFAELARRRGAELRIGRSVRVALRNGTAIGVEVDGRLEGAQFVIVAGGPWTPSIVDPTGDWRPIRRVWGAIADIQLDRPPRHVLEEAAIDIEPAESRARTGDKGTGAFGFSLITAAGASALGSSFLDDEPDPLALVPRLRQRGARYVPAIADAPLGGARSCARPVSADGRPLVGRAPGLAGAFIAAGHGPWGISTGPASARLVADLALGREPAVPRELDPGRFGSVG